MIWRFHSSKVKNIVVCVLGAQEEYDIRIKREEKENRWQQLFLFRDLVKFLA